MNSREWEGSRWAEMVARQGTNPTMDKKLIITICPVGALVSRKQNPNVPRTPQEIARQTIESYQAGASVAHLHNRDEYGRPVTTTELLKLDFGQNHNGDQKPVFSRQISTMLT